MDYSLIVAINAATGCGFFLLSAMPTYSRIGTHSKGHREYDETISFFRVWSKHISVTLLASSLVAICVEWILILRNRLVFIPVVVALQAIFVALGWVGAYRKIGSSDSSDPKYVLKSRSRQSIVLGALRRTVAFSEAPLFLLTLSIMYSVFLMKPKPGALSGRGFALILGLIVLSNAIGALRVREWNTIADSAEISPVRALDIAYRAKILTAAIVAVVTSLAIPWLMGEHVTEAKWMAMASLTSALGLEAVAIVLLCIFGLAGARSGPRPNVTYRIPGALCLCTEPQLTAICSDYLNGDGIVPHRRWIELWCAILNILCTILVGMVALWTAASATP